MRAFFRRRRASITRKVRSSRRLSEPPLEIEQVGVARLALDAEHADTGPGPERVRDHATQLRQEFFDGLPVEPHVDKFARAGLRCRAPRRNALLTGGKNRRESPTG